MPRIYRFLTGILAFTGCLSLLITGEVNPLMSLTGLGIFPGYYRFLKNMPQAPKWAIGGLSVLTLIIYIIDALVISDDYFLAVAHLTITFQAIKSFDLKEPWDHLQVYFVSLLQLIIVSELTHSILFGVVFVSFLIAFVTAMVLAHFMKEGTTLKVDIRKPVVFISALTILMTVLFFVSVPRISRGLWTKSHVRGIRTVGFSEKVEFGSLSNVKLDPTVVMRVEITGNARGVYYWRGMTLNYFDRVSWKDTLTDKTFIYKKEGLFSVHPFREGEATVQRIFLEPMDTDVIFGLDRIGAVRAAGMFLLTDSSDALFLPFKKNKRLDYAVYSIEGAQAANSNTDAYLQLPKGMAKVSQLARTVTANTERDIDKARATETYLRKNFSYTLSPPKPRKGLSPVEDFLFNSRQGYCEHYASAMVLMLRALGIPARIVTGFYGGDMNEYGGYIIVRQSNAHSWVEAVIDGEWRRFDPTPAVLTAQLSQYMLFLDILRMRWDRYVVAFSFSDQKDILKIFSLPLRLPQMRHLKAKMIVAIFLSLSAALIVFLSWRLLKVRRYDFLTAQYLKLRSLMRRKDIKIVSSTTPSEVARSAGRLDRDGKISEFITLYEECRFGGKEMTAENRAKYIGLLKEIRNRMKS